MQLVLGSSRGLRYPWTAASAGRVMQNMLIVAIIAAVAASLVTGLGLFLIFRLRRHMTDAVLQLSEPAKFTIQLLQEQQRYLQTFGDVVDQTFSKVQEQGKALAELRAAMHDQSNGSSSDVTSVIVSTRDELSNDHLMAELAHSLATPMSGLKARILTLCSVYSGREDKELRNEFAALKSRIDMCEAVLATFRRVNQAAAAADKSDHLESITDTLAIIYYDANERLGLNTHLETNIPSAVGGFDNSFLATLLLPWSRMPLKEAH